MKINFKSRKALIGLVAFLGFGVTAGVVAVTTGGNANSSSSLTSNSTNSSTNNSTNSTSNTPSNNEEQIITDFEFSNGQFVNTAFPLGFTPSRFVDDNEGGFYAMGRLAENNSTTKPQPAIVRVGEDFTPIWTLAIDLGYQNSTTYSNNNNWRTRFHNGGLLENGDLLVFGEAVGYLLLSDNSTRVALGGIFSGESIPTTTNSVFFYGVVSQDGEFTLIDYILTNNSFGDSYIADMYLLGNDEFVLVGRAYYDQGIFTGITLPQNNQSSYILHVSYQNDTLTTQNLFQFTSSINLFINRSFKDGVNLVIAGNATGSIAGIENFDYGSNLSYGFLLSFDLEAWSLNWATPIDSLKVDRNTDQNGFINSYNVILGHEDAYVMLLQRRVNNNNVFTTYLVEVSKTGEVLGTQTLGEENTNSTYFIGRTVSGYFTLGNTTATTGIYASNGAEDLFLTIMNEDFEITSFEIWGGNNLDAMQTWPTVLNNGTLIFGAYTNSTTGDFAEAFNKTTNTEESFLIVLS